MFSSDFQTYIYLHGFASSPQSQKATYLSKCFSSLQISLKLPDLNQGDFSHLTLTRQLAQVQAEFPPAPASITLIGSSFGGLTSAWLAQQHSQVKRVVLLAPAFEFLTHWRAKLTEEQMQRWEKEKYLSVYHYGQKRSLPLSYEFIRDAGHYLDHQLQRPVPTLILHGIHDEVIPVQASRDFAGTRPWVQLVELDSDHGLGNVIPQLWQAICQFCQLPMGSESAL